jgi:hypothetical protein
LRTQPPEERSVYQPTWNWLGEEKFWEKKIFLWSENWPELPGEKLCFCYQPKIFLEKKKIFLTPIVFWKKNRCELFWSETKKFFWTRQPSLHRENLYAPPEPHILDFAILKLNK